MAIATLFEQQSKLIYFDFENSSTAHRSRTPERRRRVGYNRKADPIRSKQDIQVIKDGLLFSGKRYALRDYTIFTMGINIGIRGSDLVSGRVETYFTASGELREIIRIRESKTGKLKEYCLRDNARDALLQYRATLGDLAPDCYIFRSQKRDKDIEPDSAGKTHITRDEYGDMLSKLYVQVKQRLENNFNLNTHSMRKTFAYQYFMEQIARDRLESLQQGQMVCMHQELAVVTLMELLNHSSPQQTLRYIGLTDDELMSAYQGVGL